jgi:hypothetical protein
MGDQAEAPTAGGGVPSGSDRGSLDGAARDRFLLGREQQCDADGETAGCCPICEQVMDWARYPSPRRNGRRAYAYGRYPRRGDWPLTGMASSYDD